jgi:hypothetical protein
VQPHDGRNDPLTRAGSSRRQTCHREANVTINQTLTFYDQPEIRRLGEADGASPIGNGVLLQVVK